MDATEFLRLNPLFEIHDLDFLKVDGAHDREQLETWNKQLKTDIMVSSARAVDLKAV